MWSLILNLKKRRKLTDETEPPFPDKPQETVATTSTVTTERSGPPKPDESMLAGLSGRFYVAMVFSIGMVACMILLLVVLINGKFPTDATTVTALVGLITGFFTTASTLVAMYIGQAQKPKTQTQ